MTDRKIVTHGWAKPIPDRNFDWQAYFDDDEPDDNGHMLMGHGRTEEDAIADLLGQVEEDEE